jgi:hypothetical protein
VGATKLFSSYKLKALGESLQAMQYQLAFETHHISYNILLLHLQQLSLIQVMADLSQERKVMVMMLGRFEEYMDDTGGSEPTLHWETAQDVSSTEIRS